MSDILGADTNTENPEGPVGRALGGDRRKILVTGAAAFVVLAVGGGAAAAGFGGGIDTSTPEGALRAASTDYNKAILGQAPAKNLLKYEAPNCTDEDRKSTLSAPGMAMVFAAGVTGFEIQRVVVTGTTGKVYAKATGPGAAKLNNLNDTGNPEDSADEWRLIDGKWFTADC